MSRPLLVVAAGGLAREVLAAVRAGSAQHVVGLLDDDPDRAGAVVDGVPVLGPPETGLDRHPDAGVVLAAGRGAARARLAERLAGLGVGPQRWASVVHPRADVGSARLGAGAVVLSGVVATAEVLVGDHVVLMPNVTLTHDVVLESFATLCAGVTLGGSVRVGRGAYLGMSCAVRENLTVGPGAVVGMGAVVLADVPADQTWVGVPARPFPPAAGLRAVR